MKAPARKEGSVLVAVLWCVAVMAVVVIGAMHETRMDLLAVKNYGDRIQAHYLALAGVERAKALLYHDAVTRRGSHVNHNGQLYDDGADFQETSFGRGEYTVFHRDNGAVHYGVSDEESRLNVNTAPTNQLSEIPGMTPDVPPAIVDWRNAANAPVTPGGAKADYYESLQPPYEPRNGALQTTRELLMVRGVSSDQLLGDAANNNDDDDPLASDRGTLLDSGWAALFTVNSTDKNLGADGQARINIKTADASAFGDIRELPPDVAQAIASYSQRNNFQSVADLLDVTNGQGGKAINAELLMKIADRLTAVTDTDQSGLININTAGLDVLHCLPDVDQYLAQAIISQRSSGGYFANIAELLKVPNMTPDILKEIGPLITARSETFRIVCEGKVTSSGVRERIEEIVHISQGEAATLAYREDL